MKRYFTTVFLLVVILSAHAQKWGAPAAVMKFNSYGYHPPSYGGKLYNTDTIIQGQHYIYTIGSGMPSLSYFSGDTVYFYLNGAFRPSMYFGVNIGDTVSFYNKNHCTVSDTLVQGIIDSTSYIYLGSDSFKVYRFLILTHGVYSNVFPDSLHMNYAEKLGFVIYTGPVLDKYVDPLFYCQPPTGADDSGDFGLCNYGDSTILGFWVNPDSACIIYNGIHDLGANLLLQLFPDPGHSVVYLRTNLVNFNISIYDVNGICIRILESTDTVDISDLPIGLYLFTIRDSIGNITARKFIIE